MWDEVEASSVHRSSFSPVLGEDWLTLACDLNYGRLLRQLTAIAAVTLSDDIMG